MKTKSARPQVELRPRAEDEVTEAGIESFPASDPPAYNMAGRRKLAANAVPRDDGSAIDNTTPRAALDRPEPSGRLGRSVIIVAVLMLSALALWLALL